MTLAAANKYEDTAGDAGHSPQLRVLAVIPGSASQGGMIFAKREVDALNTFGIQARKSFLLSRTSPWILIQEWWRLRREINSFKPDVIHCHFGTMTAFLVVCATKRPIVITYRGSDLNPLPSANYLRTLFAHILSQLAAIRARGIICVSHELVNRLLWGRSKATVIPTGVNTEMFYPVAKGEARVKLGWNHNDPVVLFNAGGSPRVKRIDLAEMAVAEARKVDPSIKLVILRGDIPPDDIPLYHNASDVLLLTSDYEGSPTVVQEAIACGLPVVSVAAGDVVERLANVAPSKIVPREPALIGTALLDIIALKQRSNGPEIAAREFSNKVLVTKLVQVLRDASGKEVCPVAGKRKDKKGLLVWLVTIGEPVPLSGEYKDRLHRAGQFAMWASSQAKIVWWTSAFDHMHKRFVVEDDSAVTLSETLQIRLLKGCGYDNNISLRRIRDQRLLAKKLLSEMSASPDQPDIILCSLPPVELANAAVKYGRSRGVPVVLDLRDMWPDIFVDHVPAPFRWLARLALFPLSHQARQVCREATAIIGITESFVEWGLRKAGRARRPLDKAFPFAYSPDPPSPDKLAQADAFWDSQGIRAGDGFLTISFFGSINRQFDFNTVIQAFRKVGHADKLRLVICGVGCKLDYYKNAARDLKNIHFAGWVDAPRIHSLMRRSHAGLDPLPDRYDFLATINNKAIEYLSAGLPVISCPRKGELFELLERNGCGVSYNASDFLSLAAILSALVDSPEKIKTMSLATTRCFQEKFTSDKIHGDILRYLKFVTGEYRYTGRSKEKGAV